MRYKRMPIEVESPEQLGYATIECNLAESSMNDAVFRDIKLDLNNLILCYGDHLGKFELRELIAAEYPGLSANDVLVTAGAAAALFITATSLLDKKDHIIVMRPNYSTNIETPRAIGCEIDFVDLKFENNFQPDITQIQSLIKPNTRLISITNPHNPTGITISKQLLQQLVELAEANKCYLLMDETYRDLTLGDKLPLAATLSSNVISVSSVSKTYGLPGIRIGWIITKNTQLQELFLAGKEQVFLCNSVVDEEIAYQLLKQKQHFLPVIQKKIKGNFTVLHSWMSQNKQLEWVPPVGGVVCFPRIKQEFKIDTDQFYDSLYKKHKTLVGPGHWFEMDKRYMRIGYGWPGAEELKKGLDNIAFTLKECIQ